MAEGKSADKAAPLLDPAETCRSTARPGDRTGDMDVLFNLRFLGFFSLRSFGGCWATALEKQDRDYLEGYLTCCGCLLVHFVITLVTCWTIGADL